MTIPKHLLEAKICNKDTCEEIRTLKDCCTDAYETGQEIINDLEKENQRLNNVLNEFDKWLDEESEKTILSTGHLTCLMMCKNKLQELKESKNEQ